MIFSPNIYCYWKCLLFGASERTRISWKNRKSFRPSHATVDFIQIFHFFLVFQIHSYLFVYNVLLFIMLDEIKSERKSGEVNDA